MTRLVDLAAPALFLAFGGLGCERREAIDPHEAVAPVCLGVTAPPEEARSEAEAVFVVTPSEPDEPSEAPGTRLRHVVSLGFIGDGKLTEIPSYGAFDESGLASPSYYPSSTFGGVGRGASYRHLRGGRVGHGQGFHGGATSHGGGAHGGHGTQSGHGGHGGHGAR